MQNRYFGDVGDFGKYGLLRKLCGLTSDGPQLSLGVVWYLVPDEGHNNDGRHISYLRKPEYRACDPVLFDGLKRLLDDGKRSVSKLQNASLLPADTEFFDEFLTYEDVETVGSKIKEARLDKRQAWLLNAAGSVQRQDVVFLDPDNGFEVKSVKKHADKGVKYVFWDEAKKFSAENRTLVIYHHLNRTMNSSDQVLEKLEEFGRNLPRGESVIPLIFKRGSHRVFFVIPARSQHSLISKRMREMTESEWAPHIELFTP